MFWSLFGFILTLKLVKLTGEVCLLFECSTRKHYSVHTPLHAVLEGLASAFRSERGEMIMTKCTRPPAWNRLGLAFAKRPDIDPHPSPFGRNLNDTTISLTRPERFHIWWQLLKQHVRAHNCVITHFYWQKLKKLTGCSSSCL